VERGAGSGEKEFGAGKNKEGGENLKENKIRRERREGVRSRKK
jgi:hypothetical protein